MIKTLHLGAGPFQKKRGEPYEDIFCDIRKFNNIDVVHDLDVYPWPFQDNEFDSVIALHLVEHLNSLVGFMDECWRILKPGAGLYLITPEAGVDINLTHADPTHKRCYRKHSFINYFFRGEAEKFDYTKKLWCPWVIDTIDNCVRFHGSPIK